VIFLVLGTQKFQMNRLIRLVDGLVADGKLTMPVAAQIGWSEYEPKNFQYHRFLDKDEFDKLISDASIVITHGGVSSIITAIKLRKPVIVFPRLEKYAEHVDDHQREIARAFAQKGFVLCCDESDDLIEKIKLCEGSEFQEYISQKDRITQLINDFLSGTFYVNDSDRSQC